LRFALLTVDGAGRTARPLNFSTVETRAVEKPTSSHVPLSQRLGGFRETKAFSGTRLAFMSWRRR
jgi:hypothetical protein